MRSGAHLRVLKIQPTGFAGRLDTKCNSRTVQGDSKVFGLSNWEGGVATVLVKVTISFVSFRILIYGDD